MASVAQKSQPPRVANNDVELIADAREAIHTITATPRNECNARGAPDVATIESELLLSQMMGATADGYVKNPNRALRKLDVEFRMPVVLCDMEGLSYEEIAEVMKRALLHDAVERGLIVPQEL